MQTIKKVLCVVLAAIMLCSSGIIAFATGETGAEEPGSGGIIIDEDASEDLLLYGRARRIESDNISPEEKIIELTPLETWSSGSVWYNKQIAASAGFTVTVDYWAGGGRHDYYGGADGIVLTFANTTGLGSDGGCMGFVEGSYGVELDSYFQNPGDPAYKHAAIIYGQVSNHLCYTEEDRVDDSCWHTLKVEYIPGTMKVYIDDGLILTQENITMPDEVYLGISAATGAGFNRHVIKNFIMEGIVSSGEEFGDDTDPIIIVPGIMGSRLFEFDGDYSDSSRVWDPPVNNAGDIIDLHRLNELMNYYNYLYVRPCENQNDTKSGTVATYGREYGAQDTYKNLVDGLCKEFPDREIYLFSYDWRKSNEESAVKLMLVINSLGKEKVDIVCHSMGGLVTSSYVKQFGFDKVDKIITCGTPYEGSPKLINSVLNWDVLGDGVIIGEDNFNDFFLGAWGGMTKDLKSSFYGVAELVPTKNYIKKYPMWKDSWKPFSKGDYKLSYDKYAEICKEVFGYSNFNSAEMFQDSIHGDNGYNVLLDYDKSYFLIGTNQKTISAVKFQWSTNDIDDLIYETKGDGTVPYYSASIMNKIENLDSTRWVKKSVDHTHTVRDSECISWVKEVLKYGVSKVENDADEERKITVIRIACPVDVTISCGGEVLSSEAGGIKTGSSFGRLDIIGENDEIKLLCIDTSEDYDIVLNGKDEGTMDYAIRFFDEEGEQYDERIFEDVALTEDTVIYTDADPDEETVLSVDADNDGNVDEIWTAKEKEWVTTDDENRVKIESVSFEDESMILAKGKQLTLSAVIYPLDATDKTAFTYISSDESIATVDDNGVVTGNTEGDVVIKAVAQNGMEAEIEIMVKAIAYGDTDGNKKINILDANLIRRYSAKMADFTEEQFLAADVDGNGKINIMDSNIVRRFSAKMIDKFPVE